MPDRGATVEFRDVTKRYADQIAVDTLSFTVPAGKICILVGPSGSGKTTSLKMVNRLIEPTAGAILIDGHDVTKEEPTQLRRRIGYVIQQVGLFPHQTIAENVATVPVLIGWTKQVFGADTASGSGRQWGATAISEQTVYMEKMGSHTARYAAASALWSQAGGDSAAGEEAYRSFNWASYMCDSGGIVSVAAGSPREFWFSDGYGDYIDHFLAGMGALPEWAPPHESHLLQSSSVITEIDYGSGRVAYRTFDRGSTEELRLTFKPILVSADGRALPLRSDLAGAGYTVDALPGGDWLLRVRHQDAPSVAITG